MRSRLLKLVERLISQIVMRVIEYLARHLIRNVGVEFLVIELVEIHLVSL
jgi:hypothetical protein